jgi:Ca-activated chloride channel family protein
MLSVWFAWPWWWPVAAVLPLLAWWLARRARAHERHLRAVLGPRCTALVGRPAAPRRRAALWSLVVLGAALALLQPVHGVAEGEPAGPDAFVCLDLSWSMAARDAAPSRLEAAQRCVHELAAELGGGRLGLCVFAGAAELRAPLSSDPVAVAQLASALGCGDVARGGTDPGAAIDLAQAALLRAGATAGTILVLSDGEDSRGGGAAAAGRAAVAGYRVHGIGFGSETGSKIVVATERGEQFLRDAAGTDVVSMFERAELAALAEAGGGQLVAGETPGAMAVLVRDHLAPRAAQASRRDPRVVPAQQFGWPLSLVVLCWMLLWCLPERRR